MLLTPSRLIVGLALAVLLSSCCSCPPPPEVRRLAAQNLATPDNALAYFQAAYLANDPHHEYLVFSEEMKRSIKERKNQDLSFSNYILARDEVLSFLRTEIGDFDDLEIGDPKIHPDDPTLAEVPVSANGSEATIEMIRQVSYGVWWTDPSAPPTAVILRTRDTPMTREKDDLVIRLALMRAPGKTADDVHRVSIDVDWKILNVKGTDLAAGIDAVFQRTTREKP